jgi:hypothetical protein
MRAFTSARFCPTVQIPAGGQAEGAVGVPRAGIAVGVGGERPHQAFGRHALAFNIGGEIHLRAKIRLRHSRLRFRQPDALFGNLHIRRVGERALNQIIQLWVVVVFPPVGLRPAIFTAAGRSMETWEAGICCCGGLATS